MLYNCLRIAALAALASGTLAANASAQASDLDGKVVIKNAYLAQKYITHANNPDFVHDEAAIKSLLNSLLANHALDAAEKDLIHELNRTDVSSIELTLRGTAYDIPVANADGRRILGLVINPMQIDDYWDKTPEKLAELAEYYSLSNAHRIGIKRYIAGKLHPAWKKSNITNQYEPFRKALGPIILASKNANSPESHRSVRIMMYGSCKYLDEQLKDTIPDHLCHWLKPAS